MKAQTFRLNISDIARRAEVSRPTVTKFFAGKPVKPVTCRAIETAMATIEAERRAPSFVSDQSNGESLPSARDVTLCWNPGTSEVAIFPPDHVSTGYRCSGLGCYSYVKRLQDAESIKLVVFIAAHHLIVRDGCNPAAVHKALLGIREYVMGLSDDCAPAQVWLDVLAGEEEKRAALAKCRVDIGKAYREKCRIGWELQNARGLSEDEARELRRAYAVASRENERQLNMLAELIPPEDEESAE